MIHFLHRDEDGGAVWKLVVWNWKTGDLVRFHDLSAHTSLNLLQVLDLTSMGGGRLVKVGTQAIFLDEFCMAVIPEPSVVTEFTVFNTLVSQDHSGYLQRLALPPEFHGRGANIRVDRDRDLGTPNKDEVLLPDPAQAVLAIDLLGHQELRVLLVMRSQVLVKRVYTVHTDSPVPWHE